MNTTTDAPALRLTDISKRYSGQLALDRVSFAVMPGEIHALLGENGAGKSTMAKIIAGVTEPDEGTIEVEGERVSFAAPSAASAKGIAMVYQENSLVETMSVTKNMFLRDAKAFNRVSHLDAVARHELTAQNFHIDPTATVADLGAAQKQMVEIARAINDRARVIIFDEPTASVTPEESRQLFLSMHELQAAGVGIVFITHNLEEALEHADRITVMRDGVVKQTSPAGDLDREAIVRLMVGRDVEYARHPATRAPDPSPTLEFDDVTMPPIVQSMSFSAFGGEVVVLAGLVGAGRSETAMIAAGALKRRRSGGGVIRLDGRPVRFRNPRQALRAGVVYITEDRKTLGMFPNLTIFQNISAGDLSGARRIRFFRRPRQQRRIGARLVERFGIRALNPAKAKVVELSGGNQQKVMIARSLTRTPKVVVFDEPTRGVDVGSIEDIHRAIRSLAEDGVAVIVISSYLPEVLALADRVLVARGGRVVAEFSGDEATEETIMFAAVY
jgi:ABC-type sugar transport system ATPase subunit